MLREYFCTNFICQGFHEFWFYLLLYFLASKGAGETSFMFGFGVGVFVIEDGICVWVCIFPFFQKFENCFDIIHKNASLFFQEDKKV